MSGETLRGFKATNGNQWKKSGSKLHLGYIDKRTAFKIFSDSLGLLEIQDTSTTEYE